MAVAGLLQAVAGLLQALADCSGTVSELLRTASGLLQNVAGCFWAASKLFGAMLLTVVDCCGLLWTVMDCCGTLADCCGPRLTSIKQHSVRKSASLFNYRLGLNEPGLTNDPGALRGPIEERFMLECTKHVVSLTAPVREPSRLRCPHGSLLQGAPEGPTVPLSNQSR
jgi:hypothetical protein